MQLNVVILTNYVPPYRIPFFKELEKRFYNLFLLISTKEIKHCKSVVFKNLKIVNQRSVVIKRNIKHAHGFSELIAIHLPYDTLSQLIEIKPEVIISGELGFRTLNALIYKKIRKDVVLIYWATLSQHTEKSRGFLRNLFRRWILPQADAIVVNGSSGERYIRQMGISKDMIFRVPYTHGLNIEIEQLPVLNRFIKDRILYVGQLIERKGLQPFINTLCRWAESNPEKQIRFELAGDGPLRPILEKMSLPGNLKFKFWGNLPYDQLPNLYARGGIFAFPSLADEWGVVINEAMAAGLPVLGSLYCQAVNEMVKDGVNGWTFRPDYPDEIFSALERANNALDEELLEMSRQARTTAMAFSPDSAADKMLAVIDWCIARKHKTGQM
ncbi:MAG TPA: glycosyltransferase family 4 protein [bacterium]|nr:glycosyltransferase family 4 protein [bacterium]HQJ65914.1 glycosyltransferase family 4 protein [bacterium]